MLRTLLAAPSLALALALPAAAQDDSAAIAPHDLPALIECRGSMAQFAALAPALEDPLKAVALGWQPLPQANMFMSEFKLTAPIRVFGHDSRHIAFSGGSVLAILDMPDPRPLAKQLELETAIDTPAKAMFGKELRSEEIRDAETGSAVIESIVLNVSNVDSHPGKTLVGCTYSLDLPEEEGPAEGAPENDPPPTKTPPAAGA